VMYDNEMLYGEPLPAKDPVKESKRMKAVKHQRVLEPGRFYD